ncbi:MAG: transposase [Kiritimatiellia bacterium]
MLTQERRRAMKTDAFRIEMFKRATIEGTHSELKRGFGLDRSRYRGLAKYALQAVNTAAVCNIKRWSARRLWEHRQHAQT